MNEKKLIELRQSLTQKIAEARNLTEEGKVTEAETAVAEAEAIKNQIRSFEKVASLEGEISDTKTEIGEGVRNMNEKKLEARNALVKALSGQPLTAEERALLVEGTAGEGQTSAAYIVPEDVQTEINEYKRQYKSFKDRVDVEPTNTNSGSFAFEDTATLTELVDLTEGGDMNEQVPNFNRKSFAIKDKGALLPVSNSLLTDGNTGLFGYVGKWFARKAVKTENKDMFAKLVAGKAKKAIADLPALSKVVNKDLDPELLDGAIIVTNQDGFDFMDSAVDANGRPMLQIDPTNATKRLYKGLPIDVYSNANLPTVATKAPILVGNFLEAIKFVDRQGTELAVSKEAGFTKNITYMRAIERYDVVLKDVDAYINGELTIA